MAVAFDAKTATPKTLASGTSIDLTAMTVGSGANRALIAIICSAGDISGSLALNWDNTGTPQSMTAITGASWNPITSSSTRLYLFGLVNPTSGNKTLHASWTGNQDAVLGAISFTGVNQTGGATSFAHGNKNAGSGTAATVTITSATGNMIVGAVSDNGTGVVSVNNTQIFLDNSELTAAGNYANGAASVAMTATMSSGSVWGMVGVDVVAAGGGATFIPAWVEGSNLPVLGTGTY